MNHVSLPSGMVKALGIDRAPCVFPVEATHFVWAQPTLYRDLIERAVHEDWPWPDAIGAIELDRVIWNDQTAYEAMGCLSRGEDFARLEVDGQRWFLLFVAEALYGPEYDPQLLVQCWLESQETL